VVREGFQGGTRIGLLSVFLDKKNIFTAIIFTNRVLLINFGIFVYLLTLKIATNSHTHFFQVEILSILVFQTFDRMIFGILSFPGTRWCVLTVRDPHIVRDQKKFGGTTWFEGTRELATRVHELRSKWMRRFAKETKYLSDTSCLASEDGVKDGDVVMKRHTV